VRVENRPEAAGAAGSDAAAKSPPDGYTLLVAAPSVPDLAALVELLRAHPGVHRFGSTGAGTAGHLAGELFRQVTQSEVRHLAFPGSAPLLEALAAGRIAFAFEPLGAVAGALQAGRLRARLQDHLRAVLQLPQVAQRTTELGAAPPGMTPDAFAAFALRDAERWRTLANSANIRSAQ
jgi:tripartite-type tricarboxylate transporter receptor subunit TctC